jgi:hypothetical protein
VDRRTDVQTEGHEEAKIHSSQIYEGTHKAKSTTAPVHVVRTCRGTMWGEGSASRSTALPPGTERLAPIEQETGWAPGPVIRLWRKRKLFVLAGRTSQPPRCPVQSLDTAPTELLQCPSPCSLSIVPFCGRHCVFRNSRCTVHGNL